MTPTDVVALSHKRVWWRCPVDPSHEWESIIGNRVRGRNCPFCRLAPRSRVEVYLAYEIARFIEFDKDEHKVRVANRIMDVDILIPVLKLVIEFDGAYWHSDKSESDRKKTRQLEKAGWRVIRAREEPLQKLAQNDVIVPKAVEKSWKQISNIVLLKIQEISDIKLAGLSDYLRRKSLVCRVEADKYIEMLLEEMDRGENSRP